MYYKFPHLNDSQSSSSFLSSTIALIIPSIKGNFFWSKSSLTFLAISFARSADLAKEIAKKVNEDFDQKKLPLMLGMINAIVDDKKLELDWESFRWGNL